MENEANKLTIAVINGPNMNMLGTREVDIYGHVGLETINAKLIELARMLGVELVFFQSNYEGDIVNFIQQNLYKMDGVVINPAAFTKVGYSILDALTAINTPFVEVHMSNIFCRGNWHAETIFAERAVGHINGFQSDVYELGLEAIVRYLKRRKDV